MADIDTETPGISESTTREDARAAGSEGNSLDAILTTAVQEKTTIEAAENLALDPSVNPMQSATTIRPTVITAVTVSSSGSSGLSAPHPKKFSAVNINKKFLQKNSSSPISSSPISANSPSLKSGTPAHPIARPTVQLSASHSRLVTTKLTATPQPSTTTGPGWSRPSSANPSVSPSPPAPNANGPTIASAPTAPQLPHAGKVIQPQHRATAISGGGGLKKDASGKPVWGNVGRGVSPPDRRVQSDFPTAAEVASVTTSVRKAKLIDAKEAAENAAADKQARSVEADTFRGVHLDPNAHHWDEMEEDDDNFLDGVIEFGDGRQYKIQPTDVPPQPTGGAGPTQYDLKSSPQTGEAPLDPVSKEERFADDYDRSWPRSKTSPAMPQREPLPHSQHPMPPSPSSSQATHSPQDPSRVLFNERSNKLEPYSSTHSHRPSPGPSSHPLHGRGSLVEAGTSSDTRAGRDLPPHTQTTNVQLLQKPGAPLGDGPTRPGPFGPIAAGSTVFSKDRLRDKDSRRQFLPGQDSNRAKDQLGSLGNKDQPREGTSEPRGRRLSNMGPPPIPSSIRGRSKEAGRQLPPHLSQTQTPPSLQRRLSSREPQPRAPSIVPSDPPSSRRPSNAHLPSHSPILSHGFVNSEMSSQTLPVTTVDLEQVHKTAMHLSAERAKQRRQQEEEERAKQMERARQKAAELEEKLKASKAKTIDIPADGPKPSDIEVTKFLEDAVNSASPLSTRLPPGSAKLPPAPLRATPTQPNETSRAVETLRSPQLLAATPSPTIEADSWRSKAKAPTAPRQIHARSSIPAPPATPKPPPPMLHSVEAFAVQPDEDLEIVDFSDMGKFVGIADSPPLQEGELAVDNQSSRSSRPVAADFFSEKSSTRDIVTSSTSDTGPWRRKQSRDFDCEPPTPDPLLMDQSQSQSVTSPSNVEQLNTTSVQPHGHPEATLDSSTRDKPTSHDPTSVASSSRMASTLPLTYSQRPPRPTPAFREAAMSTLDDAMSRIKGALDGMQQTTEISKEPGDAINGEGQVQPVTARSKIPLMSATQALLRESNRVPSALRPHNHEFDQYYQEVFDITMPEPPRSPKPAWNAFIVRLPRTARLLEPLTKRQYHLHKSPPGQVRWDILSFNPPVEGMNRRDFSLNDVLFRKPLHMAKNKRRYVVSLPKAVHFRREISGSSSATTPKIRVPSGPVAVRANGVGAFGRLGGAIDSSTWRKSAATPSTKTSIATTDLGLNTVSRSPPPDLVSDPSKTAPTKVDESVSARSRSQPKMPAGSAVAFYRDSRVDSLESAQKSSVNFTVTSELEDALHSKSKAGSTMSLPAASPSAKVANALSSAGEHITSVVSELKSQPTSPDLAPTPVQSKADCKSSDDSTDHAPITPPSQSASASWTKTQLNYPVKDSPARAPDPEHLKAVWSQASDKDPVHPVNSLEGIADDLTGLPFTLQDVKSEDGETPPPTSSAAPSRMSLHDVTRAFQQVPSSTPNTAPQRSTPLSPSSAGGPVARHPNFQYSLPPPTPNMRPSYATYPSPMMSHSPSPTLVYPSTSPVPGRIAANGHSPMFNQPLWVPLPAPPNQTHGMMRPIPSSYSAQMMPYPSPNGAPSMYGHHTQANMQNPASQQGGAPQARGRGIPPLSPAMQHTAAAHAPMYASSPILMHAPGIHGHSYISTVSAGRGQLRNDTPGHSPMLHAPSGHHPSSHTGYTPVQPTSFAPPNW